MPNKQRDFRTVKLETAYDSKINTEFTGKRSRGHCRMSTAHSLITLHRLSYCLISLLTCHTCILRALLLRIHFSTIPVSVRGPPLTLSAMLLRGSDRPRAEEHRCLTEGVKFKWFS